MLQDEVKVVELGMDKIVDINILLDLIEVYAKNIENDIKDLKVQSHIEGDVDGTAFTILSWPDLEETIEEVFVAIHRSRDGLVERALDVGRQDRVNTAKGLRPRLREEGDLGS